MGTEPIAGLLLRLSMPMLLSLAVQALYNMVDSIFLSWVSEEALSAVSLAFVVQIVMTAAGTGISIGMCALIARALGEKNHALARRSAANGLLLVSGCVLISIALGTFLPQFYYQNSTVNAEIRYYGMRYLPLCMMLSCGMFYQLAFERLLQSAGLVRYAIFSQLVGAITNIVLDPILIFGLIGVPPLDSLGAAMATVAGQVAAGITAFIMQQRRNAEIRLTWTCFQPDLNLMGKILEVGIPSMLNGIAASVANFFVNRILLSYSTTAMAVLSVYTKVQSFVRLPQQALNCGMVPLLAFNYGAKNWKRAGDTIRWGMFYLVPTMVLAGAVMFSVPGLIVGLFRPSEAMLALGKHALKILSVSFLFAGFGSVFINSFQALGSGRSSLIMEMVRQLILRIPAAYLMAYLGGIGLVWWCWPISEIGADLIALLLFLHLFRNKIRIPSQMEGIVSCR